MLVLLRASSILSQKCHPPCPPGPPASCVTLFINAFLSTQILAIWNYIEHLRIAVSDLNERVVKAQENVETIKKIIVVWKNEPLFKRIESDRKEALLDMRGSINLGVPSRDRGLKCFGLLNQTIL